MLLARGTASGDSLRPTGGLISTNRGKYGFRRGWRAGEKPDGSQQPIAEHELAARDTRRHPALGQRGWRLACGPRQPNQARLPRPGGRAVHPRSARTLPPTRQAIHSAQSR